MQVRAEIVVKGLVQGVGFRYFVVREAEKLGVKGFTKNLYSGEVLTVVEGEKGSLDNTLYEVVFPDFTIIPCGSCVNSFKVDWLEPKNEFETFEIRF